MSTTVNLYAFADEASPTLEGQIAALLRNGMEGLEIRGVDGENISDIAPGRAREIRRRLDDAGLVTWSIGSPIGKIDIVNDDFSAHMDKLRRTLDTARLLGAENLRMFSFYLPKDCDPASFRDEVLGRLERMLEAARGSGVTLCHENEKGIYGDNAARCLDIHRSLPALAGIFDPANFVQCGQGTAEAWAVLKPYIRYLHVKDALADGSVVPIGHGVGHAREIIGDYLASGGTAMTLEPHLKVFSGLKALEREGERSTAEHYAYESGDAAFDAAATALRELLDGLNNA